jgi:ATP-dependent DNA helicase UvrD/PcrA
MLLPGTISARDIALAIGRPEPTPEQVAVIEAPTAPLLVVAGAGSGKTETMAARVVWLVANQLTTPDQVLGLTFTRKAAAELAERVRRRLRRLAAKGLVPDLAEVDGDPDISTYHAFAGRLVREHALRLGVEPESRLLTEAASWQYAQEVVERWPGDMSEVGNTPSTIVDALLKLSGECAEHLIDPESLLDHVTELEEQICALPAASSRGGMPPKVKELLTAVRTRRVLVPLLIEYADRKRAHEALDFGDQLALAARLAREFPDIGRVERARTSTVLLDEFQDTSHAQLVMLRELFGGGHSVTAVGDPHQSIYGWRGASAGTLSRFPQEFATAAGRPATQLTLSTSWRNDDAVLAVANVVAGPLRERAAQDGRLDVPPLVRRPDAGVGRVQAGRWLTRDDEAAAIAEWVAERWRPGGRTAAVLCRTRSQFVAVDAALRAAGLPVEVVGLGGLLSTPEVVDVVSALHVIADPDRGDALMRLLTGPICRIGARDLAVLGRWAQVLRGRQERASYGVVTAADAEQIEPEVRADAQAEVQPDLDRADEASIVEALDTLPRLGWRDAAGRELSAAGRERLGRLGDVLRALRSRTGLPLPELVVEVERGLQLDIEVAARPGYSASGARAHLDALAEVAAGFAASAEVPTLSAFLSWLEAAEVRERGLTPGLSDSSEVEVLPTDARPSDVDVSPSAVQVLTVHAAKGLEWDVVAIPGLVEGILPMGSPTPKPDDQGGWEQAPDRDSGWRTLTKGGLLPYGLRGDAESLPELRLAICADSKGLVDEIGDFESRCGAYVVSEERRLAYVAFTRAKSELLLTCHVWGSPTKTPRLPSRFLLELLESPETAGVVEQLPDWAPLPEPVDGLENPAPADQAHAPWPYDPLGSRRPALEAAAARVRAARAGSSAPAAGSNELRWADEIELLLAERDRAYSGEVDVELPVHLSASRLVRLAEDPAGLAGDLRRPMPRPPAPEARRGTAFHAWVEQRFGAAAMVDVLELPGAADEGPAEDERLPELQANFLASEWADRIPTDIEVAIETPVAGTVVRGRIDAVFPVGDETPVRHWDVVDWKTGTEPHGAAATARAVQLAAYRLAWARLQDVPVENVGAAFFYAATGRTVRPVDLLDEAALERLVTGG